MKLSLGLSPDLEAWLPSQLEDPSLFRRELNRFLSHFVMTEDQEVLRQLGQELRRSDVRLLEAYISALQRTPASFRRLDQPDYFLKTPMTILSAEEDGKFLEAKAYRTRQAKIGEPRDLFYQRTLGHLVEFCREVHFYDPYIIENLLDERKGAPWLVWEKLSKLPLSLHLHGALKRVRGEPVTEYAVRLKDLWGKVSLEVESKFKTKEFHPQFELSLNLHSDRKHDRYGRVVFARNNINFDMSKGAEIYDQAQISENYKLHLLEPEEYDEKSASWNSPDFTEHFSA